MVPVAALWRLPKKGEFVFQTDEGRLWRNNVGRDFQVVVKRSRIRRCTIHDLRRTFVSHLAMAGVNEAVARELAAYSSITTTLRSYAGIMPEALRAAPCRLPYADVLQDISDTYHEAPRRPKKKEAETSTPVFTST